MADRFKALGLEPAGDDGTYYQNFRMSDVGLTAMPTLDRLGADAKRYVPRTDFSESVGGRRGGGVAEGRVVYVGGGNKTTEDSAYLGGPPAGHLVMIARPSVAQQGPLVIAR